MTEDKEQVRKELREAERMRKSKRADQTKAAEEHGDNTRKWPGSSDRDLFLILIFL
jgi:hypothetical protein